MKHLIDENFKTNTLIMNNDNNNQCKCRISSPSTSSSSSVSPVSLFINNKPFYLLISLSFNCLLRLSWIECSHVFISQQSPNSIINNHKSTLSPLTSPSLSIYHCNNTVYPENNGCHPLVARCESRSQLCICNSSLSLSSTNNEFDSLKTKQAKQRHFERKRLDVYRCLPVKKLGQTCEHSVQCYSMVKGSGCYRSKQLNQKQTYHNNSRDGMDHWQCSCPHGSKDGNECSNETVDHDKQKCDNRNDGYRWISLLRKCIANDPMIHYSMRVGRAGGGRSGGGGGSVGRSTGSRSWFSNRRNDAAVGDRSKTYSTTIIIALIFIAIIIQ